MKNLFSWKSVAVSVGLLALLAAPANAQSPAIRADVPFAFTAANQTLPPGQYRFAIEVDRMLLKITDLDGTGIWVARLVPGGSDRHVVDLEKGMLRFHQYGGRYFLSDIWRSGTVQGNALMPSRVPKELGSAPRVRDVKATK